MEYAGLRWRTPCCSDAGRILMYEPTNHLDRESIIWLGEQFRQFISWPPLHPYILRTPRV